MAFESVLPPGVFLVGVGIAIAPMRRGIGHGVAVLANGLVLGWVIVAPRGAHLGGRFLGFEVVPVLVEPTSRFMGFTFALIAILVVVYAFSSGRSSAQTGLAVAYAGLGVGAVFSGDWLLLLVFWELMAVASAFLIWSSGGAAVRAGFRYAVYHGVSGLFLIGAVALQYVETGSFLFDAHPGIVGGLPAVLAAVGIGINAGFVALHAWIPDAYPKAHFVVGVVLCGFTTKTAVYALFRAFPGGDVLVAYMGGLMALYGVTYALLQTDMRRLLSYHIQSQVGYMVAGIGIGSAIGVAGGFAHLFNNVLYKSLLFMVAGVIVFRTGRGDLKELGGLARLMPLTFIAFLIAALSIVGVPGFNGYVSKALVKTAAKADHLEVLKWMFTLAGVGTAMSFAKFGYYAFFGDGSGTTVRDARPGQVLAMGVISMLCLVLGLAPGLITPHLPGLSDGVTSPYSLDQVSEAIAITFVGLGGFVVLRSGLASMSTVPDVDVVLNPLAFYSLRGIVRAVGVVSDRLGAAPAVGASTIGGVATRSPWIGSRPSEPRIETLIGHVDRRDLTVSLLIVIALCAIALFVFVGVA